MGQTFAEGRPQPARSDNPKTRSWRRKPLPNLRGLRPKLHQQMVPTVFGAPFCSTRACARCWLSVLTSVTAPLPTDVLFPSPSILFFLFFPICWLLGEEREPDTDTHRRSHFLSWTSLSLSAGPVSRPSTSGESLRDFSHPNCCRLPLYTPFNKRVSV